MELLETTITPAEAGRIGHLNLLQFYRESPTWSRGGVVHEEAGTLLFATDSTYAVMMNGAFRSDDRADADHVVRRAREFFRARGRGFSLWLREGDDEDLAGAATKAGLTEVLRYPEMLCFSRLETRDLADDVKIRRVATVEEALDFVAVNAQAYTIYGMPAEAIQEAFSAPERMLCPHVVTVVAYVAGEPAAAALTIASHGIAGVYWVGTLDRFRGRGLGEAVTRAVTNAGFDLGARLNSLQASPMGEPIYRRMGYGEVFRYRIYTQFDAA